MLKNKNIPFVNLKADYHAYNMNLKRILIGLLTLNTFWLVALYRVSAWLYSISVPLMPGILRSIGIIIFSSDISPSAKIGPGFRIAHSVGIVIGGDVVAGANFELFQNVTLGGRDQNVSGRTMPTISDNVTIFSGAVVLGPIIIGEGVSIGANAVVINNFPSYVVVAGVPARVIGTVDKPHALRSMEIEE